MTTPKEQLANLLAKAALNKAAQSETTVTAKPKELETVTLTQFIGIDGKVYWAKSPKTPSCIRRHLVTKQVVKGSAEDQ